MARAEIQKYFRLFFGSNENFKICFLRFIDLFSGPLGLGNCNVELKGINGSIKSRLVPHGGTAWLLRVLPV